MGKLSFKKAATAFFAVAALAVQPLMGSQLPTAWAAVPSDVWVKSAMPNPVGDDDKGEFIVLENKTSNPISLTGWSISDNAASFNLSGNINANSTYKFCTESDETSTSLPCDGEWSSMSLSQAGETLTLREGTTVIDQVSYNTSSEGALINFTTHTPAPVYASLNTENFNTVDGNYKGVSVGFNASNFGTVYDVVVTMERSTGSSVTKTANQAVKDLISNQPGSVQITAPFVIQEGTFTEASDTAYWQPSPASWDKSTVPTSVTISVTDENGTKQITNSSFNQGSPSWPTYESLLPVTLGDFPSTNDQNKTSNYPYVEQVTASPTSVTLRFVNPTANNSWFEYRLDDAESTSTYKHGPCRVGASSLPSGCGGKRYLTKDDLSYSSQQVNAGQSKERTFSVSDNVAIRMTFGPERSWDFDWTAFETSAEPKSNNTVEVTGNTASAENDKGKWLFNRDPSTATSYEFNDNQQSIGNGSLYVPPIGASASNKFIGELFVGEKLDDVYSVKYDYRLGDGVATSKATEFYANVYVNFDNSTNYGDCVYNVMPGTGTAGWNTVKFDPAQTYDVRTRNSASSACPAKPADLPSTAEVRMFAINAGDTSANDQGVSGYFDNVVLTTDLVQTTYDFEPQDTTAPEFAIENPANGSTVNGLVDIRAEIIDDSGIQKVLMTVPTKNGNKTYVYEDGKTNNSLTKNGNVYSATVDTNSLNDGVTHVVLRGTDKAGNTRYWNNNIANRQHSFTVDNTGPGVSKIRINGETISGAHKSNGNCNPADQLYTLAGDINLTAVINDESSVSSASYKVRKLNEGGCTVSSVYSSGAMTLKQSTKNSSNWNQEGSYDSLAEGLNGTYAVQLTTKDAQGNQTVQYIHLNIDNVAPQTAFTSPTTDESVQTTDVAGTLSDNENITQYSFNITGPGVSWSTKKWYPHAKSVEFDVNLCEEDRLKACDETTLPEGRYTVRIAAYDGNGNRDISSKVSFVFTKQAGGNVNIPGEPTGEGDNDSGDEESGVDVGRTNDGENRNSNSIPSPRSNSNSSRALNRANSNSQVANVLPSIFGASNVFGPFAAGSVNQGSSNNSSNNESDDSETDAGDVLGTATTGNPASNVAAAQTAKGWNPFEMAWYWWLATAVVATGLWLLIAAAIRRLRGVEA